MDNMDNRARGYKKTVGTKAGIPKVAGKKPTLPKRTYGTKVRSESNNLAVKNR